MTTTTRFLPDMESGPVHPGHIVTMFINYLYAKRHKGVCYFCPIIPLNSSPIVRSNYSIFKSLRVINTHTMAIPSNNPGFPQEFLLRKVLGELGLPPGSLINDVSDQVAMYDFIIGTDTLIRGDDWAWDKINSKNCPNYKFRHLACLNQLRHEAGYSPVTEIYIPCVDGGDKEKLSSSGLSGKGVAEYLDLESFNLTWLLWFIYSWEGSMPCRLDEVENYQIDMGRKTKIQFNADDLILCSEKIKSFGKFDSTTSYLKGSGLHRQANKR